MKNKLRLSLREIELIQRAIKDSLTHCHLAVTEKEMDMLIDILARFELINRHARLKRIFDRLTPSERKRIAEEIGDNIEAMTKIFCQNCYSTTHAVAASVHDVNTNGTCSKCGSEAVLSPEVVAGAINAERRVESTPSEDRWAHSPQGGQGKRMLEYNHSFIHKTDINEVLIRWHPELERWWDGHYFQLNYNFLYYRNGDCYSPTLDVLLENKDGSQRYITFEVTLKKLEPVDSEVVKAREREIEP